MTGLAGSVFIVSVMKTVIFLFLVVVCMVASLFNALSKAGKIRFERPKFNFGFRHNNGQGAFAK